MEVVATMTVASALAIRRCGFYAQIGSARRESDHPREEGVIMRPSVALRRDAPASTCRSSAWIATGDVS